MSSEPANPWRRFLRIGADHPAGSLFFIVVTTVIAIIGILQISIATGYDQLVARDGPDRQAYLHIAREFGSDNRTFVYVRDEQLWSPAKLKALEQIHNELRQLPFVERIDDLFTAPAVRSSDGQLAVQPLLAGAPADSAAAESARDRVLDDPVALRNLVSADGKAVVISVSVREGMLAGSEINDAIERVLQGARGAFPSIAQVGPSRLEAELRRGLKLDLAVLGAATALVMVLTALALGRNLVAAVAPLLIGTVSVLWSFGAMGFLGIPVSLLFAVFPTLVLANAATEVVRMATYRVAAPAAGDTADWSAQAIARDLGAPSVLTALTLALGHASGFVTGIPTLRDFGFAMAFAILANGLVTILLLPTLQRAVEAGAGRRWRANLLATIAGKVLGGLDLLRRPATFGILAIVAIGCIALVRQSPQLRVVHDPLAFFSSSSAVGLAADRINEDLAGTRLFYLTLDANAEGVFRDPLHLQRLSDIQAFIAKQQGFGRSLSLADLVSQANREAAGGRGGAYHVPPARKLVGQYLVLFRAQDLAPYVSHDFRRANIVIRHHVRDAATLNRQVQELRLAASRIAGAGMTVTVAGEGLLISESVERLLKGTGIAVAGILLLVLVVVSLMFTSFKGGLIALVPTVLPVIVATGLMRAFELPVSIWTVPLAILAVGAVIHGTGHMFSRYSECCRDASDYHEAVVDTVEVEVAPVVAVGLSQALIFAVLGLSEFAVIAQFGALASIAILVATAANLFVTPLVMSRIRLVGLYEILAMSMQRKDLENCPLFHGLTSYQIRKTILISELREYADGEVLIRQGTVGRSMYLVVSGQIEVLRQDNGARQRLALLGPGDVFGEIGFVLDTFRTADVTALGSVSVLRFDHHRLKRDLLLFPRIMAKLNFNISGILGRRLAEIVETYQPTRPAAPVQEMTEPGGRNG
jgi:predicted RND superfamily exporter protein